LARRGVLDARVEACQERLKELRSERRRIERLVEQASTPLPGLVQIAASKGVATRASDVDARTPSSATKVASTDDPRGPMRFKFHAGFTQAVKRAVYIESWL